MLNRDNILKGRELVENYRRLRRGNPKNREIYNNLTNSLKELGFDSVSDFSDKNNKMNVDIFSTLYTISGSCTHECHGRKRGCTEEWYQKRMKETNNGKDGELISYEEAYRVYWLNDKYSGPPACPYKLVKIKDNDTKIDIRWK